MAHPDLGLYVSSEFENREFPGKNVWSVFIEGRHRLISRSEGGSRGAGSHYQRCRIFFQNAAPNPSNTGGTLLIQIGGDFAVPTSYVKHEPKDGTYTYNFHGGYHVDNPDRWLSSSFMTVSKFRYQNGFSYVISYDKGSSIIDADFALIPNFVADAECEEVESLAADQPSEPDSLKSLLDGLPKPFWT